MAPWPRPSHRLTSCPNFTAGGGANNLNYSLCRGWGDSPGGPCSPPQVGRKTPSIKYSPSIPIRDDEIHIVRPPRLCASSLNSNGDRDILRTRNPVRSGPDARVKLGMHSLSFTVPPPPTATCCPTTRRRPTRSASPSSKGAPRSRGSRPDRQTLCSSASVSSKSIMRFIMMPEQRWLPGGPEVEHSCVAPLSLPLQ